MADPTVPQVVRSYLAQLERALAGLPAEVRDEILAGIREELVGLDAAAAAARIEALGDPKFIAAEARAETDAAVASEDHQTTPGTSDPRWYPVLAALLVAFGGVVIPVIGWVVGIALVLMSKTWNRAEKWIAVLTPFLTVGASALIVILTGLWAPPASDGLEVPHPELPHAFDIAWSSVTLVIAVNAIVGIWLLWRAKRSWSPSPSVPVQSEGATLHRTEE